MTHRPGRRRVAIGAILALAATGSAYGYFTASGTASGQTQTGTPIALTTVGVPASGALLAPGGTAPLTVRVTNPGSRPVVLDSIVRRTGAITLANALGACTAASSAVSVSATVVSIAPISLGAGQTLTTTIPGVVSMGATAANGCQGATFTIPVTLSGRVA